MPLARHGIAALLALGVGLSTSHFVGARDRIAPGAQQSSDSALAARLVGEWEVQKDTVSLRQILNLVFFNTGAWNVESRALMCEDRECGRAEQLSWLIFQGRYRVEDGNVIFKATKCQPSPRDDPKFLEMTWHTAMTLQAKFQKMAPCDTTQEVSWPLRFPTPRTLSWGGHTLSRVTSAGGH